MAINDSRSNKETRESLELQQRASNLQKEGNKLLGEFLDRTRSLNAQLQEQLGIKSRLKEEEKATLSLSRKIISSAQENNEILRRQGSLRSQLNKDLRNSALIESEISAILFNNRINQEQILKDAEAIRDAEAKILKLNQEKDKLKSRAATLENQAAESVITQIRGINTLIEQTEQEAQARREAVSQDTNRLAVLLSLTDVSNDLIQSRKEEVGVEREINKNLGIAGLLLDNLNKIGIRALGGIGINLGSFSQAIEEGADNMNSLAEAFAKGDKLAEKLANTSNLTTEELNSLLTEQVSLGKQLVRVLDPEKRREFYDLEFEAFKLTQEINELGKERVELSARVAAGLEIEEGSLERIEAKQKELLKLRGENLERQGDIGLKAFEAAQNVSLFSRRFKVLSLVSQDVTKAVVTALIDPISVGSVALKGFFNLLGRIKKGLQEINVFSTEFARLTGRTDVAFAAINDRLVTTIENLKTLSTITEQIGLDAGSIFNRDQLAQITEATKLLGLSAEQGSVLALRILQTGKNAEELTDELLEASINTNRIRGSAVSAGIVLRDVLSVSQGVALSFGNSVSSLSEAATIARSLGLTLQDIDSIASSLLNFESSIESELQAQVITGRNINLNRARELALVNDLAGLGEEITKNLITGSEFASITRIEQESIAQALGITRDQLAQAIIAQDTQNSLTEEQRRNILGVSAEDFKRLTIQEKLNTSLNKFVEAFGPLIESSIGLFDVLLEIVTPIAKATAQATTFVSKLLKVEGVMKSLAAIVGIAFGVKVLASVTVGLVRLVAGMASFVKVTKAASIGQALLNTRLFKGLGLSKLFASSQASIAASSAPAAKGLVAVGGGLGRFGVAAASAIPVILSIGAALLAATPFVKAFGKLIIGVSQVVGDVLVKGLEMLPQILDSTTKGFSNLLATLSPSRVGSLFGLGPALFSASAGLVAISTALAGARALGVLRPTGSTTNPTGISTTMSTEDSNLSEMLATKLESDTAQNEVINETNQKILTTLNELLSTVKAGGNISIDGNKLQEAFVLGTYKT